jgi:hypothetical protein
MGDQQPYFTIRTRKPADGNSLSSADSTVRRGDAIQLPSCSLSRSAQYGSSSGGDMVPKSATHDISRTSYHVKHISRFAHTLEEVS